MGATETTKVVGLDFTVKDQTAAPSARMAKSFEHVTQVVGRATHSLQSFGRHAAITGLGAVGLGIGFHSIAEKAKEANLSLEHITKKLAGAHFAFDKFGANTSAVERMNVAMARAEVLAEELNESEGKLKVDRLDLAKIYANAYFIGERQNLQRKEMIELTEKLAAGEKVLGISSETAALKIATAASTGRLMGTDLLTTQLRVKLGASKAEMKKFAAMSEGQRFEKIMGAMGDLVPAAQRMGQDLEGSIFSIKEAVDQVFRNFTGPVFREVTTDLRHWSEEIERAEKAGRGLGESTGSKLVKAYQYLKSTTAFIAENWKSIALILGSSKAINILSSLGSRGVAGVAAGRGGGAMAGAVGSMNVTASSVVVNSSAVGAAVGNKAGTAIATSLRPSMKDTIGHMAGLASQAIMVTQGLTALYLSAEGLAKMLDSYQNEQLSVQRRAPRTIDALTAGAKAMSSAMNERAVGETFQHLQNAFSAYGLKPGQNISAKTIAEELRALSPDVAAKQIGMYGIKGASVRGVQAAGYIDEASARIANLLNGFAQKLLEANPDLGKPADHIKGKGDIKIDVHGGLHVTQDFKQADPDRIFHRIPNDVAEMVLAPHASNLSLIPE